jgi:3-oxoacyl-[acyl-carrier-protein] synthase II
LDRRVVVTGMGMVSPLGLSVEETWEGLLNGRSGVGLVEDFETDGFPARIAAQVKGFDALNYLGRKEASSTWRARTGRVWASRWAAPSVASR